MLKSRNEQLSDLAPIEYWAEELTPPLYGITDTKQPPCKDNFMCVYEKNTAVLYFINGRDKQEAEAGFKFFSKRDSVQEYTKKVREVLRKQKLLKEKHLSLMTIIKISREFNGVYAMTEEASLKKFEATEDKKTWSKFKKIAELRLRMRKELESILYLKSDKALDELARLNKMKRGDLFFYTYEELQSLLNKHEKVASRTVQDRKRGYVYLIKDGKPVLFTGKKFRAISNELRKAYIGKNVKELKGRAVSGGIVRGKVQLVLNNSKNLDAQIRRFKKGMILVTEMTRPKTLIACYRARAIITDEGGIVSHAAITARELKIPCVVGTKIATKVLKNGDMVEVNAAKGIIKILEK